MHEQNVICSKTLICRQLFAGNVVISRPMKRKEKIHQMINLAIVVVVNIDGGSLPLAGIPIKTLLLKNHYLVVLIKWIDLTVG